MRICALYDERFYIFFIGIVYSLCSFLRPLSDGKEVKAALGGGGRGGGEEGGRGAEEGGVDVSGAKASECRGNTLYFC